MKPMAHRRASGAPRAQRGLSLVTTLIFMLAALALGLSVLGVTTMQERITGNSKDRDLALQAAEAALRDAESDINNFAIGTVFSDNCNLGLCTRPSQRATPDARPVDQQASFSWSTATQVRNYGQYTLVAALPGGLAGQPTYVIEQPVPVFIPGSSVQMGVTPTTGKGYRITARAVGARAETVVILQEIYATP